MNRRLVFDGGKIIFQLFFRDVLYLSDFHLDFVFQKDFHLDCNQFDKL